MHEDERALGILPPDIEPRATDAIDQMFYMIESLIEKGIAYQGKNGDVYYSVRKFKNYGKLSGKNLDELEAGARVNIERLRVAQYQGVRCRVPVHLRAWQQ
jgi:cysteinyl-tRNA synthetase